MNKLTARQKKSLVDVGKNAIKFTAPLLAIFFAQLAGGVDFKQAFMIALYAGYALMADFFKKLG